MFNFTTQTIFNQIIVAKTSEIKAKTATKGYNVIVKDGTKNPEIRIGNVRFNKENLISFQLKKHTVESLTKVEFDIAKAIELVTADSKDVQEGSYRIALYLGLTMGSQDSFYANDLVYKGKPLYIEFPILATDTAEAIATRIVKIANKYMLFTAQEKLLDVSANSGKVTFEGVNGYQIITKASLQKYDPNASQIDCCNNNGDFVDVMTGVPLVYTTDEDGTVIPGTQTMDFDGLRDLADNEIGIVPGAEAFGDYNWIMHNLRIPTAANTAFWAPTKNEMPIVGGQYTQFIVRMCVERDGIAGQVVGQRATSVTTHVFYVLDQGTNVNTLKTELEKLITAKTDADDALADPYASAQ